MSKKLYLQWADFKDNISSAIGELRDDKEFTDVTHGFFKSSFWETPPEEQTSPIPHPLIFLRGF